MEKESKLKNDFKETLNRQGFGFKYAVIKEIQKAKSEVFSEYPEKVRPSLHVDYTEIPIEANGKNTRLDFVLTMCLKKQNPKEDYQFIKLIAQCKRTDSALSDWCFMKTPFKDQSEIAGSLFLEIAHSLCIEKIHINDNTEKQSSIHRLSAGEDNLFQIPVIVNSEPKGSIRKVFNKTITRALRGQNGFINLSKKHLDYSKHEKEFFVLPVIFTTANIWASDFMLDSADLKTGNFSVLDGNLVKKSWILYNHNQRLTLKHTLSELEDQSSAASSLSDFLHKEYTRPVAIVNSSGIKEFLVWIHKTFSRHIA
jgi:hypothetical protein